MFSSVISELRKGANRPQCNSNFMSKIKGEDFILRTLDPNWAIERNIYIMELKPYTLTCTNSKPGKLNTRIYV